MTCVCILVIEAKTWSRTRTKPEPELEPEPEHNVEPDPEADHEPNLEEALHDVAVEVEIEAENRKIIEDDAEFVDSNYAQPEDDYMCEKMGKMAKGSNKANL